MLLLIQRLTQRPKKRSETEKEVVGIKLQSPQSPSATQQGGRWGGGSQRGLEEEQTRDPRMQPTKQRGRLRSSGRLLAIR